MSCYHCVEPACLTACPVDAIVKRQEDGIVIVDEEKCLGFDSCSACLDAGNIEESRIKYGGVNEASGFVYSV